MKRVRSKEGREGKNKREGGKEEIRGGGSGEKGSKEGR